MSRYKMIVAYDGTAYHGFAKQPNALTVQEVLEKGIEAILGQNVHVIGSGRTDTGVHAKAQCCIFDAQTRIPDERMARAFNSKLPSDIVVQKVEQTKEDFHPRYAAKRKTYRYQILNSKEKDPFLYKYAYFYPYELNIGLMQEAAKYIVGEHDFACFCSSGSSVSSTVREVYNLSITKNDDLIQIEICGNGFLYNMVRIIVGTLIDVGIQKKSPEMMKEIIESKNRKLASYTAPPEGLTMLNVEYEV